MDSFRPKRALVTGGAGFIGSAVVRRALREAATERVVVYDLLTYAGHRVNLAGLESDERLVFVRGDICDRGSVEALFREHAFDSVLHLAAESHVDRSIESADVFVRTNVTGTFTLMDVARRAWDGGATSGRFVHVSTDEVFGALGPEGRFTETTAYAPNSPYAASKAASDLLVRSYHQTYGFPAIVTNTCNNYGERQLPEKLVPLVITNAAQGLALPVYGKGAQVREWIHVDDHAEALWTALTKGKPGESYLFGSGVERSNLEMVHMLADLVDAELKRPAGTARELISFVTDRKGHDFRYAIDSSKAERELGWTCARSLEDGLASTVKWYLANGAWREEVTTAEHQRFQKAYYAGAGGRAS